MIDPAAGVAPVEWIYLDPSSEAAAGWLRRVLPHCSWRCHVVLLPGPGRPAVEAIVEHLHGERLATVYLHPIVEADDAARGRLEFMLELAAEFHEEAYRERSEARLLLLPILEMATDGGRTAVLELVAALRERIAKPSVLAPDSLSEQTAAALADADIRVFPTSGSGAQPLSTLADHHVLDGLLDRIDGSAEPLAPCPRHLVVAGDEVFSCLREWQRGWATGTTDPAWMPPPVDDREHPCVDCTRDVVLGLGPALRANRRLAEGHHAALVVGRALARRGDHESAADLARAAGELAGSPQESAAAALQEGLTRLEAGRLEEADAALQRAAGLGADRRLTAYHRGRVQVAWRDDLEALERFDEALAVDSDAVATEDLHFAMALSHIRVEEWSDARRHLGLGGEPTAPIVFNLGVCLLNEGELEAALDRLDEALAMKPDPDDLGRILFFCGFCFKEMGRLEEAALALEEAVAADPGELAAHNLLGFCLFKLGRHADAVDRFRRAVEIDPTSAIDWANLGVNLERLGNADEASETYRHALSLDPTIGFAAEGLARLAAHRPSPGCPQGK